MENIIILTGTDKIKTAEFTGLKSIQTAVDGYIETCVSNYPVTLPTTKEEIRVVVFCNEEALLRNDDKMLKFNALNCLAFNTTVYGDVAVLIDNGDGTERGFTDDETNDMLDILHTIKINLELLKGTHRVFDRS